MDPKRQNAPMDRKEVEEILTRYTNLDSYLKATGSYVVDTEKDGRELTHTGLNGRRYSVKPRDYPAFKALLCRDLNRSNIVTHYICEFLMPKFRMFADMDMVRKNEMSVEEMNELCVVLQESMDKYYGPDADIECAVFWTAPERQLAEHGEMVYRYGLHFVWHMICVNKQIAIRLYTLLLADLNRRIPNLLPPNSTWDVTFDAAVYGDLDDVANNKIGKKGSLRMPGNEKMKVCKACKRKDTSVMSMHVDPFASPFASTFAPRSGEEKSATASAGWSASHGACDTSMVDDTIGKQGTVPDDVPIHLQVSKAPTKRNAVHPVRPVDAPLNAAGVPRSKMKGKRSSAGDCVVCNSTGKISLGRPYRPYCILDRRGKVMEEKTKEFTSSWEVAIELGHLRISQDIKLTESLTIPSNPPPMPYGAAASMGTGVAGGGDGASGAMRKVQYDKNGDPIPERKRNLPEKVRHLEKYLSCPDNEEGFKENTIKFKYVVRNDLTKILVEKAIREYNANYKDIILTDLRTDKNVRPCSWLCTVEGYGSQYCLNKGANHNSSSIYFKITPKGFLYQRCNCRKKIVRLGGSKICPEYSSAERPLPVLIRRALTWTKKDSPGFETFEDESEHNWFINKTMGPLAPDWVPPPPPEELYLQLIEETKSRDEDVAKRAQLVLMDAAMFNKLIANKKLADKVSDSKLTDQQIEIRERRQREGSSYMMELAKLKWKLKDILGELDDEDRKMHPTDARNLQLEDITAPVDSRVIASEQIKRVFVDDDFKTNKDLEFDVSDLKDALEEVVERKSGTGKRK